VSLTAEKAPFTVAFADLEPRERYKLLCATVVPRPIALVTSVGSDGVVNAAPFSFFNVFSEDPPLIMFAINKRPDGVSRTPGTTSSAPASSSST